MNADYQAALDDAVWEHEKRARVDWYFEMVEAKEPVRFSKTLVKVTRVKTETHDGRPSPGKVRLTLEPDEGSDEFETIETDWLRHPWAWRVAQIAKANVGERIVVTKINVDPDTKAPQGYRQCVWVSGPNWPTDWDWQNWPGNEPWVDPHPYPPAPTAAGYTDQQMEPF